MDDLEGHVCLQRSLKQVAKSQLLVVLIELLKFKWRLRAITSNFHIV